jgi:hypothetical protein
VSSFIGPPTCRALRRCLSLRRSLRAAHSRGGRIVLSMRVQEEGVLGMAFDQSKIGKLAAR